MFVLPWARTKLLQIPVNEITENRNWRTQKMRPHCLIPSIIKEWVKDVITPRKPSQKSAALFGWWPPQRKKNWVFFFVFAPEAQRLFPWAPVHCFYPTNCTAVMKHANQRFKMLYVWGKAKPLGHCFNLTMQKHTGPWLFDLINIKDHICTPWSKRSLLPAASLTPSGCVISWATAFSPPPSGT